ncbi:S9 family peptidase [Elongatibacter sediminis]|uniref:S9 family peptidase n=1 Tax=Elongatibacter sediminis TaxID=3119006 RepID=A0AAW9REY6_9GAMM
MAATSETTGVIKFRVFLRGAVVLVIALGTLVSVLFPPRTVSSDELNLFQPADVFDLAFALDPRIAPDGKRIAYIRHSFDIMTDRKRKTLWLADRAGTKDREIPTEGINPDSPRWSPDGVRLAYISSNNRPAKDGKRGGKHLVVVYQLITGESTVVGAFEHLPSALAWSPNGEHLAFLKFVPAKVAHPLVKMPDKPAGAKWAEPARVIDYLVYRTDGVGLTNPGYTHLFVTPVDPAEGAARQLTSGEFNHDGPPSWSVDSQKIYLSANRRPDWEYDAFDTEIHEVAIASGEVKALTDRAGPDNHPVVSPDGLKIAYTGFDDRHRSYQKTELYVMNTDGSGRQLITGEFDYDVHDPVWRSDNRGLYFQYSAQGVTRIAFTNLVGEVSELVRNVGGTVLDRPYASGSYSVSRQGDIAFTLTGTHRPADVAVAGRDLETPRQLTRFNDDLLKPKSLGTVEEIRFESSLDQRSIQGWVAKPPGFRSTRKYPLILEIHGGPDANYGDRFSAQNELFTAAGYMVLFVNPRGSTSYGTEFASLTDRTYPRDEFFDLMSGVDALVSQGNVDEQNLFITGGSAGGVLTSWVIGNTDRFRAAAVVNPAMNWSSYALTTDRYDVFSKYFFPGFPWEYPEHYWKRSPLSLAGNVSTPTLLITGEKDTRTPISETEQFYQALKLRRLETMMVRIPGAGHNLAVRPSNLIAKVSHIIAWFEKFQTESSVD